MRFSSHNVALPGGTETAPGRALVAGSAACRSAVDELKAEFGPGPHHEIQVADLGCLEGGYAAEFARLGYNVLGIEARQENYDSAVWLASVLGLPNLGFIHGDARDLLPDMQFDAVFCCGLLYHLDRPVEFLNMIGKATRRMLILNTHYSMEGGHPEADHLPTTSHCELPAGGAFNEGRAGHWFCEEDDRYASFGNTRSFWLTKPALLSALLDAGFDRAAERPNWRKAGAYPMPWGTGGATPDRGMFVAFKGERDD